MFDYETRLEPGGDRPDIFTRLSIAMCLQDDGTRPVNPTWVGSDIGWLSPAIQFAIFPVPAAQPTDVSIQVNNLGTADACGVLLETAYNIYIGNQAATMVNVQNLTIPIIPAGSLHTAKVIWTPQDTIIAHACFHARVFDNFSMLHNPARCLSWDSYVNPQAGNHNTIILKIPNPNEAAVIAYPAINTSPVMIQPKLLVTVIDNRIRFSDLEERFPLPFVPERVTAAGLSQPAVTRETARNPGLEAAAGVVRGRAVVDLRRAGALAPLSTGVMWPSAKVNERFVHNRFGFDVRGGMELPPGQPAMGRAAFFTRQPLANIEIQSYNRMSLMPNEEKLVRLVIPPTEFPPPGRRKKFQVDYQIGDERPVQNFLYLYN